MPQCRSTYRHLKCKKVLREDTHQGVQNNRQPHAYKKLPHFMFNATKNKWRRKIFHPILHNSQFLKNVFKMYSYKPNYFQLFNLQAIHLSLKII